VPLAHSVLGVLMKTPDPHFHLPESIRKLVLESQLLKEIVNLDFFISKSERQLDEFVGELSFQN
jgi:hypothetical protein